MAKCRSCNSEIQWVKTKSGQTVPLDLDVRVVMTPVGFEPADKLGNRTPIFGAIKGFASHFTTCGKKR